MRKIFILSLILFSLQYNAFASIMQGGVEKEHLLKSNKLVESSSNTPIANAKISLPLENYSTYSASDGTFNLNANINGQTVLTIEKAGYKPFTMTLAKEDLSKPIIVGIEKSTPKDIIIEQNLFHLGDNNFSDTSANAGEFKITSVGPFYSKTVKIGTIEQGKKAYLTIGSIIGIDTLLARQMGQNKITSTYATPPQVYFNGQKIAEIQLNGDGQRIRIPNNIIKQNNDNQITIKTGRNALQTSHIDYDDIEIANLQIETY